MKRATLNCDTVARDFGKLSLYEAFLKVGVTNCDTIARDFGKLSLYDAFLKVGVTNCDTVAQKNLKLQLYEGKVLMYRVDFCKRSAWLMSTRSNPITKFIFDY